MMRGGVRRAARLFRFSLRSLILLIGVVCLALVVRSWLVRPEINVALFIEGYSFSRYDDHAGSFPLGATVRIVNFSQNDVWFIGYPGSPTYYVQQLVDDEWVSGRSLVGVDPFNPSARAKWARLRSMESVTILIGPVSDEAKELRF